MKKFKITAIALLIGVGSLFATETNKFDAPTKEIRNQIINLLGTPEFVLQDEMTVLISFTFSSNGEIVVLNVNSSNKDVLNFIRENLNYKAINNPGEKDKLYTIPLKISEV